MDTCSTACRRPHARLSGACDAASETVEQPGIWPSCCARKLARAAAARAMRRPRSRARHRDRRLAEELRRKIGGVWSATSDSAIDQMERELRQVRDAAERLRLVPAGSAVHLARARRARRCAGARKAGRCSKATGGDVRLDADVLGSLQSALIQIVRNAVAHGIETEDERAAPASRPRAASRFTSARRGRGDRVRCRDDGRGIDLDAVRAVAVQRGLAIAAAERLERRGAGRALLLRGGISTSATVTEVSGRGIGLDVVREAVERLGGEVDVRSRARRGHDVRAGASRVSSRRWRRCRGSRARLSGRDPARAACAARCGLPRRDHRATLHPAASIALSKGSAIPFVPLAAALDAGRWSARSRLDGDRSSAAPSGIAAIGVDRLLGTRRDRGAPAARPPRAQAPSSPARRSTPRAIRN